MRGLEQLKHL